MPAPSSSPIRAVSDQLAGLEVLDPVQVAPGLRRVLAGVVNPRARRGVRHGLVTVLAAAVRGADLVPTGARSYVTIAE